MVTLGFMKQIRISSTNDICRAEGQPFICGWMEASLMNRWLLKIRLAEALAAHGEGSHWVETRDSERAPAPSTA